MKTGFSTEVPQHQLLLLEFGARIWCEGVSGEGLSGEGILILGMCIWKREQGVSVFLWSECAPVLPVFLDLQPCNKKCDGLAGISCTARQLGDDRLP